MKNKVEITVEQDESSKTIVLIKSVETGRAIRIYGAPSKDEDNQLMTTELPAELLFEAIEATYDEEAYAKAQEK